MSAVGTTIPKDEFLGQIWSVCTTLTEEALNAARAKCQESAFDPNRGLVPLEESFINLTSARVILEDAIEKQELVQLPLTVQREILSNLQSISKSLLGLTNGVDEVVNLTTGIETLNTSIWKYGLHNLSDQVLGYQKKLNQIKNQELQISKAINELNAAQRAAEKTGMAAKEVEQKRAEVLASLEQVKQNTAASTSLLEQVKDNEGKTSVLYATIQQHEKQSGELTSNVKTASNELQSLDASIRKFYADVDEYRRKITQTNEDAANLIKTSESRLTKLADDATLKVQETIGSLQKTATTTASELAAKVDGTISTANETVAKLSTDTKAEVAKFQGDVEAKLQSTLQQAGTTCLNLVSDAQQKLEAVESKLAERSEGTIEANHKKTEALITELNNLKEQIKEQIEQATGFRLFGAFQARQNEIVGAKDFWKYAIFVLVVVSAMVTAWIAHEAQYYTAHSFAFWVKLSLTVPLGFLITFCTVQYSRERRLEEEYAFKSSISVSLNPYRELVHSILAHDGAADQGKYTDFVIDSVKNVFTPPTDKVFDGEKKSGVTEKTLKHVAEILGTAAKAAKS